MSRVSIIIVSSLLIILPVIFAAPAELEGARSEPLPERDEWWRFKDDFTDKTRVFHIDADDKCPVNGTEFYMDCNQCNCENGLVGLCILRGPCTTPPQIANWQEGKSCPAGKNFYVECNECKCHASGTSATCTEIRCLEPSSII